MASTFSRKMRKATHQIWLPLKLLPDIITYSPKTKQLSRLLIANIMLLYSEDSHPNDQTTNVNEEAKSNPNMAGCHKDAIGL